MYGIRSYYSEKNWPEFYYLFVPAISGSDTFANCISIHTYMKFAEVEKWKDLPIRQRGDEYEDWKASKAEKLIQLVSEKFPELKGNIEAIMSAHLYLCVIISAHLMGACMVFQWTIKTLWQPTWHQEQRYPTCFLQARM